MAYIPNQKIYIQKKFLEIFMIFLNIFSINLAKEAFVELNYFHGNRLSFKSTLQTKKS
jgi:hypothetical protein